MEALGTDDAFTNEVLELLQHRVRPRDQVLGIRRVMSRNLAKSLTGGETEELRHPLSLVDSESKLNVSLGSDVYKYLSPAQKEFVDEVQKHLALRTEFSELQSQHRKNQTANSAAGNEGDDDADDGKNEAQLLHMHVQVAELERKLERLRVADKCLAELDRQPAAAPGYLNQESIFDDKMAARMPELPKSLLHGFTVDSDATGDELRSAMRRLDKAALRNKLLAERERRKFEAMNQNTHESGSRDELRALDPRNLTLDAQLHCLNAVKDTLISWIEMQLSKAGDDDEAETSLLDPVRSSTKTKTAEELHEKQEAQLASIQREYERHVSLRKQVFALVAEAQSLEDLDLNLDDSALSNKTTAAGGQKHGATETLTRQTPPTPQAYALTPLIERLQSISRAQKSLLQDRAHVNSTLSSQRRANSRVIEDLAEASQLLRDHPPPSSSAWASSSTSRTRTAEEEEEDRLFGSGGGGDQSLLSAGGDNNNNNSNNRQMIDRWVFAADSAKIVTLESVAERAETGQLAIGEALEALEKARALLPPPKEAQGGGYTTRQQQQQHKRHMSKSSVDAGITMMKKKEDSIWSRLDGNLGLINE